mmetsp:Transcript_9201/g.13921  ORF Transcript_9201/g.13921 Transcript_9201/m.13921 type:complete len:246 (-) Transcript_9201:73-810(-)
MNSRMVRLSNAFFLLGIDTLLGRVDKHSLSQEALMDLFIANFSAERVKICRDLENPKELTEWKGLRFNESGILRTIQWSALHLRGTLHLEWLPPTVIKVSLPENDLEGSLCLANLPESLVELKLYINQLSGELHLENLPKSLRMLNVHSNRFEGTICLTSLPELMNELNVSGNKLTGTPDFTRLPAKLHFLYLHLNPFEGTADFSQLPKSLKTLYLSNTKLSGEITCDGMAVDVEGSNVKAHESR